VAVRGGPKNLRARELDAKAAYAREKTRYLDSVDALFDRLRGDSRFDAAQDRAIAHELLALAPPGIDELFAVLELLDALEPGAAARPLLVIDTAPTGHALRLLELPRLAHGWVKAMLSVLLRYQGALGLGRLAEDLVRLSRSLRVLQELLADPTRAIFLPVTRLEPLPVEETRRLLAALKALSIAVPALFFNAVVTAGCRRCTRAAREGERLAARIGWRGAIIACPAHAPAPRGVESLERWRGAWKER
jgi:arsenite-transporting ATPase